MTTHREDYWRGPFSSGLPNINSVIDRLPKDGSYTGELVLWCVQQACCRCMSRTNIEPGYYYSISAILIMGTHRRHKAPIGPIY